ncbi:10414_t:CDS:1 [Cetraspora pellucida]|uniref:10414_t:CDS:1 n=1 Tax=Cetraspora pellucida TaxID=1433469 RepID=A0A9N9NBX4_9GLOM|nr:10414_t:CDS:1 [Cetraspora pellucida]
MKFLSILTFALVLIIAIVHATPVKRSIQNKVGTQGVRFQDSYRQYIKSVKGVYDDYKSKIDSFNKEIKAAAKEDHTDEADVKWLIGWNGKYDDKVNDFKSTADELDSLVDKLQEKLSAYQ